MLGAVQFQYQYNMSVVQLPREKHCCCPNCISATAVITWISNILTEGKENNELPTLTIAVLLGR